MLQERNRRGIRKLLFLTFIPAVAWMFFIYGFSNEAGSESSSLSLRITMRIVDFIEGGRDVGDDEYDALVEKLHGPVRKAAHMAEYAVLAILIYAGVAINVRAGNIRFGKIGPLPVVVAVCVLYAMTDEAHQLFVSGRTGRPLDVIIDSIGALAGASVFLGIYKLADRKIISKGQKRV